ncbi:MAG: MATE family efflux transporter [Clostridium sp.]|nr:MATE family efflux transporter [Clostridium sp.]MDU7085705.1 MATE family efflux transporter [Clostridium sp.]
MEFIRNNLSLNKSTVKDVLKLSLPAVVEMMLYTMIWTVDTMMIGQYGGDLAVSTVGISCEVIYTFTNILVAQSLSVGITSIVARRYGAKEYNIAEEYATIGVGLGAIVSFITTIFIFFFSKKLLIIAGAEPSIISLGKVYINIVCIGLPFNMLSSMLAAVNRSYGNTKTPMLVSIVMLIVNLTLDAILIFGLFGFPELGVAGAALATTIANIAGFTYSAIYTYKKSKIKIHAKYLKKLCGFKLKDITLLSIPAGMQEAAYSIARLLTSMMIMHLGTVAFAANQITLTLENISFMPGWGFAVAATTLVGNKVGEGDYKKAREYGRTAGILGLSVMLVFTLLFLIFPTQLIRMFISGESTEVITLGAACLMIAAAEQPMIAISMIVGGIFKGYGDTKTPFKIAFLTSWLIRLPLVFIFIYILESPITTFWFICLIQWTVDGSLLYIFYNKKLKPINNENIL